MAKAKLKIGVSSCLLGQPVRYNGEHKYNQTVIDLFDPFDPFDDRFEAVPVCPEVELGMGVPREPVQLVAGSECVAGDSSNSTQKLSPGISKLPPRVVGVESGKDWTEAMTGFSTKKLEELTDLCGFVFKSRSPSCGTQGVPLYGETSETTTGLFARAFMKHFPHIPVIDEEQLQDKQAREIFILGVIDKGR